MHDHSVVQSVFCGSEQRAEPAMCGRLYRLTWAVLLSIGLFGCETYSLVVPVSLTGAGQLGNRGSFAPTVSANGRYIAFESEATDLVSGVTVPPMVGQFRNRQIYVRDLVAGVTEIVSVDTNGQPVDARAFDPSISADGRFVTFQTDALNVVPGLAQPATTHIYVRDRQNGTTALVSKRSNGYRFSQGSSHAVLVPSGTGVYFTSFYFRGRGPATIFYHRFSNGRTEELRQTSTGLAFFQDESGVSGGVEGVVSSVSRDSNWLGFVSRRRLGYLDRDGNHYGADSGYYSLDTLYLYRRSSDQIWQPSQGETRNTQGDSCCPAVSLTGPNVAFESESPTALPPGEDSNGVSDIFLFRQYAYNHPPQDFFERISVAADGSEANGASHRPATVDGNLVAFDSEATNLVPDDNNGVSDVFLKYAGEGTIEMVSRIGPNGLVPANGASTKATISEGGNVIAFESLATNFSQLPTHGVSQIYARRYFTWSW